MTRRVLLAAAAAVLAALPGAAAIDPEATVAASGLQAWLDGTSTLQASFEQSLVSGALGSGLTEKGKIWLERPGRLRWDYTSPDPKIAIVLDDKTFLYLPEDKQYIRGKLGAEQAALPELLASRGRLADLFDASLDPSLPGDPKGSVRLKLVPKRGSGSVARAVLVLDGRRFAILGAEVLDAAGNHMAYRFGDWHRNAPIPPGLFAFEPPPGTEVVDQD